MSKLAQMQQQFIAHIKDPHSQPVIDGVEDRRMAIYRDLFFNNVNGFVSSAFPVLKSLYQEDDWLLLIREFFKHHDCHSPYFVDISKEFVDYLLNEREPKAAEYPFMLELAHYEWVELDISVRKELEHYARFSQEVEESVALVLSETAWPLSYGYAVHQISADAIPEAPHSGGVHLIVYRDEDDEVQFMAINAVTGVLVQLLEQNPGVNAQVLIQGLTEALPQFEASQIASGAMQMIQTLAHRGIIRRF